MKFLTLLFCLILISPPVNAEIDFIQENTLHTNPIANPRSPALGLSVNYAQIEQYQIPYLEAEIGRGIGIFQIQSDDLIAQISIEAGLWASLVYKDGFKFPLLTEDYIISIPASLQIGNKILTLKWSHISAHLGDGMSKFKKQQLKEQEKEKINVAENLAQSQGLHVTLDKPMIYSRDFVLGQIEEHLHIGLIDFKNYITVGYIYKKAPRNIKEWFFGYAADLRLHTDNFSPVLAGDFTFNQDTDSMDVSIFTGITKERFYLGFAFFNGMDRRGQLLGNSLKQYGIQISYQQ